MKIKIVWDEGIEERHTLGEIDPAGKTWSEIVEHFRQIVKKACKYSDTKAPKGILEEGEIL